MLPPPRKGGIVRPGSAPDGIDYMEPDAAARIILDGVARRRPFTAVGRVAKLAHIASRISPALYAWLMMRALGRAKRPE